MSDLLELAVVEVEVGCVEVRERVVVVELDCLFVVSHCIHFVVHKLMRYTDIEIQVTKQRAVVHAQVSTQLLTCGKCPHNWQVFVHKCNTIGSTCIIYG